MRQVILEYASEDDLTITAFLWATWLEEGGDGINILIITPEREAQEERMKEYVKHASPARMGSDCAYYPAFILRKAWEACTRTDAGKTNITMSGLGELAIEPVEELSERPSCFHSRFQDQSCESGAQRQRVKSRQDDRDSDGYCELLIEAARDAG